MDENYFQTASRSDVKLQVEVNGFNWNECVKIYRNAGITLNNKQMLCAGGEAGHDTCNGDSGNERTRIGH